MKKRTYKLSFDGITLDTSKLRMDKRGGKEVIDYFLLNDSYTIEDEEIVDIVSFRKALETSDECKLIEVDGDRTTLEVTLELYPLPESPTKPMKLVDELAEEFGADNLWYIYRTLYKYNACGPSIGFQIANLPDNHESRPRFNGEPKKGDPVWLYCDTLGKLGTLEEMKAKGQHVVGMSVSSIVEGSDAEVSGGTLEGGATREELSKLIDDVDKEASFLWERDNSHWYCVRSPEDEPWAFHETWGELKWDCSEDDMPPKHVVAAVEKFIADGGNITWEESWGTQTHKYEDRFPLPSVDGWTVYEYLNDACY